MKRIPLSEWIHCTIVNSRNPVREIVNLINTRYRRRKYKKPATYTCNSCMKVVKAGRICKCNMNITVKQFKTMTKL